MSSVLNTALSEALTVMSNEAESFKPSILAAAATANVDIQKALDLFIDSLHAGGALGLILPSIKAAITSSINAAISSGAASEESVLFDLLVAAAQKEAKALLG